MLSSATVPLASTLKGKASYRFYNSRLTDVYKSCILPTKTAYAASHTNCSSTFSRSTVCKSSWKQTAMTPPNASSRTMFSLSSPFLAHASTANAVDSVVVNSNKRPKLQDSVTPQPPPEAEQQPLKRKPFERKEAVTGQLRTYKVLMKPTAEQVTELKRCFGVARLVHNKTVARIKGGESHTNFIKLRNEILAEPQPEWATGKDKVARTIQDYAVKQATDAYKTNEAKLKKNNSDTTYNVQFRSLKKNYTEVIAFAKDPPEKKMSFLLRFEAVAVSSEALRGGRAECNAFFGNNMKGVGGVRLEDSVGTVRRLVSEGNRLRENGKIQWDKRTKKFYFIYTFEQPTRTDWDPQFLSKRVVATDPGASPFHAWYSPTTGEYGELLQGARPELEDRCLKIDALQSRVALRKGKLTAAGRTCRQRYRTTRQLKLKLAKERRRLHGWMANAHYDSANFLLTRFDVVIEPKFDVAKLVQRRARVFGTKTARAMYTWSHYLFRQRLQSAASRYAGRHIIECGEPGTSKTCSNCGFWHADLGGNKTFTCPRCEIVIDRDVAGARNNFLAAYGRAVGVGWDGASS